MSLAGKKVRLERGTRQVRTRETVRMRRWGAAVVVLWLVCLSATCEASDSLRRIDIYPENARYWQYGGEPVLLLGGSVEDNLFQIADLQQQLDLLKSVGGNYVRCTMSSRDEGNVWPFKQVNGKYDLDKWNDEYWRRFERFLELTNECEIIVQIEVWATFDFYRGNWERNPFNPKNNVNYTKEDTWLDEEVKSHPVRAGNNFFWTVPDFFWLAPKKSMQTRVLVYQQRFVDKLLSYSLRYGNVLYCMDNETSVRPEWGWYWSDYIKKKAGEAGVKVHTTEMWDPHDLSHPMHHATFDYPGVHSFVDVSQNNHQKGQGHWDNAQRQRARIAGKIRPLNNVKIYGADAGRFGDDRDGMERFWRNIFGGLTSARFHRPPAGLGLGKKAQANIKSARMLTDEMDIFECEPHNELLSEREANEAYCAANPGKEYAVYFTDGGEVLLDVSKSDGDLTVRWLDIMKSKWVAQTEAKGGGELLLRCPSEGYWAALVR